MFKISIFSTLFALFIFHDYGTALKVESHPPKEFLLEVAMNYLKISEVVIASHENSNVSVEDYAILLHNHSIFTTLFEWKMNNNPEGQFTSFIRTISGGKRNKIVFLVDYASTENFLQHVHVIRDRLNMTCFYRWVFLDYDGLDFNRLQNFNTSAVCWNTIVVSRKDNRESEVTRYSLFGPYIRNDGNCVLNDSLGNWSSSKGFSKIKPFQKRIRDFKNRIFPAAFLNEQPFYAKTRYGTDEYEGTEYELITTLKNRLNFRLTYVQNTDGEFGSKLPNGSWTGFVGLIERGEAIFSIATLSISNRRMRVVDFSSPYLFAKVSFVVLSPALESRKFVLVKPLHAEVWKALVATFIFCTSVLYLITHSLPCKSGVRRAYNVWFLLRTLGQQGTPSIAPARYSIRFFISGWWFFIMVILWSYAGTLTSFMTYPGRRPAIDTLKKLQTALSSGHIGYGTIKGSSYENFLKTDMSDANPIFGKSLEDNPDFMVKNVSHGMEKVLGGNYAFVYMKAILKWFAATLGYDRFRFSTDVFSTEAVGVAFQKCHPCKKSFDVIIDRLEETGFFQKWYDDAFAKAKARAPRIDIQTVRSLSLDDVQGAFYFLGIGYLVACLVLFLELSFSYCAKCLGKNERKKKRKVTKHKKISINKYIEKINRHQQCIF